MIDWVLERALVPESQTVIMCANTHHCWQILRDIEARHKSEFADRLEMSRDLGRNLTLMCSNNSWIQLQPHEWHYGPQGIRQGYRTDVMILFDHWAIEAHYTDILTEWMRWDAE